MPCTNPSAIRDFFNTSCNAPLISVPEVPWAADIIVGVSLQLHRIQFNIFKHNTDNNKGRDKAMGKINCNTEVTLDKDKH